MSATGDGVKAPDDAARDAEAADERAARGRRSEDAERAKRSSDGDGGGYYLYGISRAGAWRGFRGGSSDREELLRIRYRDLDAVVRPVAFSMPDYDRDRIQEHQRIVWSASQREGLLPAPFGVVFRGRRAVIRFLQDQYIPLDEGLALVEGHWELRMHVAPADEETRPEAGEAALHAYSELRRFARSAFPFAHERDRVLSAAFLVPRTQWLQFMDRAEELSRRHPELVFDITGPWPPYDFVRMTR